MISETWLLFSLFSALVRQALCATHFYAKLPVDPTRFLPQYSWVGAESLQVCAESTSVSTTMYRVFSYDPATLTCTKGILQFDNVDNATERVWVRPSKSAQRENLFYS